MRTALRVGKPNFFFFIVLQVYTFIYVCMGSMLSFYHYKNHKSSQNFSHWTTKASTMKKKREKKKRKGACGNRGGGRKITSSKNNFINTIVNHTQLSIVGSWFILGVTTGSHPKQTSTFLLAQKEFPPLIGPCSIPARQHPCGNTTDWKREKRSWGGGWCVASSHSASVI